MPTAALRFRPPADATAAGANAAAPPVGRHAVWVLGAGDVLRPVEVETGIADERFTRDHRWARGGRPCGDRRGARRAGGCGAAAVAVHAECPGAALTS